MILTLVSAQLSRYAKIAQAGYDDLGSSALAKHLLETGLVFEEGVTDHDTDTQGFAAWQHERTRSTLVLTFRGTKLENWQNIRTDLEAIPRGWKAFPSQPDVHLGFIVAWNRIAAGIRDLVKRLAPKRIIVVGHSLGAAIATLCATELAYIYHDVHVSAITFGCPRIGGRAFKNLYDALSIDTIRVVHGYDAVPCLPRAPFMHVGGDELHVLDNGKAAHSLWSGLLKVWARIKGSIGDHPIAAYIDAIERMPQ